MKITRIVNELLPDTEFTAILDIPEVHTLIAGGDLLECELTGLEDFNDGKPFILRFGNAEAAESWFTSKWGILDYIEQHCHN